MRIPDLTIIVPVHERQWTLARALEYLSAFEGPVIVADSSQAAYPMAGRYPNVDYRHVPGELYYDKMRRTFKSVTTDFLVDVPDDDFTLLSELVACCDYMRANRDVSVCGGHIVRFTEDRAGGIGMELDHTGANIGPHVVATETKGASETLPERFIRMFDSVIAVTHAVLRKDAALRPYTLLDAAPELQPVRIFGQLLTFGAAALGRIAHLDVVLMLRSRDRLWGTAHFPKAMQKQVALEDIVNRVAPDGGVLTDYLRDNAGLDAAAARAVAVRFLERMKRGYAESDFAAGRRITMPLVDKAFVRQAADIAHVVALIRKHPPPVS